MAPKRAERVDEVLTADEHIAVQLTWHCYQELITAYRDQARRAGKLRLFKLAKQIGQGGLTPVWWTPNPQQ